MSNPVLPRQQWSDLNVIEQQAFQPVLGDNYAATFTNNFELVGQQTLINSYYLMTHPAVAGNLWQYVTRVYWANNNQLGLGMRSHAQLQQQLQQAGFKPDGSLTLLVKKSTWSWRQVTFDTKPLRFYGLQLYRRQRPVQQGQLIDDEVVVDIDAEVFNSIFSFFTHAKDVLWPNKSLNDPGQVRAALVARGIFPEKPLANDNNRAV
jgi:hypothetical protein